MPSHWATADHALALAGEALELTEQPLVRAHAAQHLDTGAKALGVQAGARGVEARSAGCRRR